MMRNILEEQEKEDIEMIKKRNTLIKNLNPILKKIEIQYSIFIEKVEEN
jgi:hypothetical protein